MFNAHLPYKLIPNMLATPISLLIVTILSDYFAGLYDTNGSPFM